MKSIPHFCATAFLVVALCAAECSGQGRILKNGYVEASFDDHGLTSVRQSVDSAQVELARDAWSITIDGKELRSTDAVPTVEEGEDSSITYRYRFGTVEIEARYRLESGWKFVSKQLRVVRVGKSPFTVESVSPWDVRVKGAVESEYTPSTYTPQFGATIAQSRERLSGKDYGAFLRMKGEIGALLTIENPFLDVDWRGGLLRIAYAPKIEWREEWGIFASDEAFLGTYVLSGERLAREMTTEWHLPPVQNPTDGMDRAEIQAFTDCVRTFLLHPTSEPISVEVGWTLNDYQIDAGTEEGRAEYKRIIDTTSELGIQTLLYAPANTQISAHAKSADTWGWEYVLWLGLGEKIRKGEWDPEKDALPSSVTEMLNYAKQKHVGLLAYVYPSVPFAADGDWLVQRDNDHETVLESGAAPRYATLSSREFQDYLIRNLIAFKRRTGIAGYSFDYAFLDLPGSSSYAQWYGWRRVMETLRKAYPEIVIDGRQSYQLYGPWSWLAGNYPHPTGNDEQPESFRPFPDLHFDRVSADRTRFVNYWYRNYQFAPTEVIPGYATHQTERSRNVAAHDGKAASVEMMYTRYRPRDWDYLGYRYSFLSSVATGGWNNVVNMIPARDEEEARWFTAKEKTWIRRWLEWTVEHRAYLLHTRTILQQPALDHVDGTSAITGDRGFLFLFNPNYKRMSAAVRLDKSIGLVAGDKYLLRELYPREGRLIGKPGAGIWNRGDDVHLDLVGTSATVIEIVPAKAQESPVVFNADGAQAMLRDTVLTLTHVSDEPGTSQQVGVLLPNATAVSRVVVNGTVCAFWQTGNYIEVHLDFAGEPFTQAQEIALTREADNTFVGSFIVPQRILDQLAERKKQWPIPWSNEDLESTWLAPERLLMFVQLAEPHDGLEVSGQLDGKPLVLTPAYSSSRADGPCMVGFYADLSKIAPDRSHRIELHMPGLADGQLQGVFFDNVTPQGTEELKVAVRE